MFRLFLVAFIWGLLPAENLLAASAPVDIEALRAQASAGNAQAQADLAWALLPQADSAERMLEVVRLAEASAEAGNTRGMNVLGALYLHGRGVSPDSKRALELFEHAAQAGDPEGWFNIGTSWSDGYAGAQDHGKALEAFRQAAQAGFTGGMTMVGLYHYHGLGGLSADPAEAARWYRRAIDADQQMGALFQLGAMMIDGKGVPQNISEGVELIERSAAQGFVNAAYALGFIYESGKQLEKNLAEARKWYLQAAEGGHALAAARVAEMLRDGEGGAAEPELATKFYTVAAQHGQTDAMYRLYEAYRDGLGVDANPAVARQWLSEAAQRGSLQARLELSVVLRQDEFRESVPQERVELLKAAAQAGAAGAQAELADLYRYGRGVYRDHEQALHWYQAAAEQGVLEAMHDFAELVLDDEGAADQSTAEAWLREAAGRGYLAAQYQLGSRLLTGKGLRRDDGEAVTWLRRAASIGHRHAVVSYAFALYAGRGTRRDVEAAGAWLRALEFENGFSFLTRAATDFRKGRDAPKDLAFAHALYGIAAALDEEDAREEQDELAEEMSADELERASSLAQSYVKAAGQAVLECRRQLGFTKRQRDDDAWLPMLDTADAAKKACRKTFGRNHPTVALALLARGAALEELDDHAGAREHYLGALEMLESQPDAPPALIDDALSDLAWLHRITRDHGDAMTYFTRLLASVEAYAGAQSLDAARVLDNLGRTAYFADLPQEAIAHLEAARDIQRMNPNTEGDFMLREVESRLADAYRKAGEIERAEDLYLALLEAWGQEDSPAADRYLVEINESLYLMYWGQERWEEAAEALIQYLARAETFGWLSESEREEKLAQLSLFQDRARGAETVYTSGDVPEAFDLIATGAGDGAYRVGEAEYDFETMLALLAQRQPAAVLVRGVDPNSDAGICLGTLGAESRARVFGAHEGDPYPITLIATEQEMAHNQHYCRTGEVPQAPE